MKHCATCTCPTLPMMGADALLHLLTNGTPHREVYLAADGRTWWVTYSGGEVDPDAVTQLVQQGAIRPVYKGANHCFHVGRTLDIERTTEARRSKRHKEALAILIYEDDPR